MRREARGKGREARGKGRVARGERRKVVPEKGFKALTVWQKAKDLAVEIYKTTSRGELERDFGLRDQIRRSAVSIPNNLAEHIFEFNRKGTGKNNGLLTTETIKNIP